MENIKGQGIGCEIDSNFNNRELLHFLQLLGIGLSGVLGVAVMLLVLNFLLILCR